MRLSSLQTYRILAFLLNLTPTDLFKQVDVAKKTKVAFSRVNTVVNWLISRGFVSKQPGGYRVTAPAALAESLSLFRQMSDLLLMSVRVDVDSGKLDALVKAHNGVYCLTSALAFHDELYRDPSVNVYGDEKLLAVLKELPPGRVQVSVYKNDLTDEDFEVVKTKGPRYTGRIRTIVDLLCSDRAYAADRLIKRQWG